MGLSHVSTGVGNFNRKLFGKVLCQGSIRFEFGKGIKIIFAPWLVTDLAIPGPIPDVEQVIIAVLPLRDMLLSIELSDNNPVQKYVESKNTRSLEIL